MPAGFVTASRVTLRIESLLPISLALAIPLSYLGIYFARDLACLSYAGNTSLILGALEQVKVENRLDERIEWPTCLLFILSTMHVFRCSVVSRIN